MYTDNNRTSVKKKPDNKSKNLLKKLFYGKKDLKDKPLKNQEQRASSVTSTMPKCWSDVDINKNVTPKA